MSSALCAQLFAQRYTLSVIKTAEPVKTITWNKNGNYFGYAERNNIVLRTTNGYSVVQVIPTYKSNINFLKFSENTAGLDMDQLATLHTSGLLDFRILPDTAPTLSLETENSEPTVMTYSHNGNYFAVGNSNGTVLLYQQNYFFWSNYDADFSAVPKNEVSFFYMPYIIMNIIDAPKDAFIEKMNEFMEEIPVYSAEYDSTIPKNEELDVITIDRVVKDEYSPSPIPEEVLTTARKGE